MLEGPQILEGLGMTHALGLTSYILGLVDLWMLTVTQTWWESTHA